MTSVLKIAKTMIKQPRIILTVLFFTLFSFTTLSAQDFPSEPSGHVNDYANLLSQSEVQRLESKLRAYRDTTSNVIAIAIVKSLQGLPREEVATTIFNQWHMWEGDRHNGVLILVAPNERQMQIEVGYGLEGAITDLQAGRIVDQILRPNFQNNDFYRGLDQATTIIMQLASGEYDAVERAQRDNSPKINFTVLFIVLIIIYSLLRGGRRGGGKGGGRRRRHTIGSGGMIIWGGGGFGGSGGFGSGGFGGGGFGGFGGGGGFGSGGGGAGGGW